MSSYQPQPFRVIRDQLLAFLVLQLLGSCTPVTQLSATPQTYPEVQVATEGPSQSVRRWLQIGEQYQHSKGCI